MRLEEYTKDHSDYIFGILGFHNSPNTVTSCLLRPDSMRFNLTVPYSGESDPISTAFVEFSSEKDTNQQKLPDRIWVEDIASNDVFCLINPRVTSVSRTHGKLIRGYGILTSDYIVKGRKDTDYSKVSGLESYNLGYSAWTEFASIDVQYRHQELLQTLPSEVHFDKKSSIGIGNHADVNCLFNTNDIYSENRQNGVSVTLTEQVCFETRSEKPIAIESHLKIHKRIASLLSLLAWRNISFEAIRVSVDGEGNQQADDRTRKLYYWPLISNIFGQNENPKDGFNFLFSFKDIGAKGLSRWLELYQEFDRSISEITYVARLHRQLTPSAQILLFGIAFEEIGAKLGKPCEKRPIKDCVKLILLECSNYFGRVLFNDQSQVAAEVANTYNAIKHIRLRRGGKSRSDWLAFDHLCNMTVICRVISTLWIAKKLGCSSKVIDNISSCQSIMSFLKDRVS